LSNKLFKVETINETQFSITEITLEDYESGSFAKLVVANDNIYFLDNNEIYYISIETGEKTSMSTSYIFYNIWSDNMGNVLFSGVDSTLNDVEGSINSNNEVTLDVFDNGYQVIYVSPIN